VIDHIVTCPDEVVKPIVLSPNPSPLKRSYTIPNENCLLIGDIIAEVEQQFQGALISVEETSLEDAYLQIVEKEQGAPLEEEKAEHEN
jgi:hypothetical protein